MVRTYNYSHENQYVTYLKFSNFPLAHLVTEFLISPRHIVSTAMPPATPAALAQAVRAHPALRPGRFELPPVDRGRGPSGPLGRRGDRGVVRATGTTVRPRCGPMPSRSESPGTARTTGRSRRFTSAFAQTIAHRRWRSSRAVGTPDRPLCSLPPRAPGVAPGRPGVGPARP